MYFRYSRIFDRNVNLAPDDDVGCGQRRRRQRRRQRRRRRRTTNDERRTTNDEVVICLALLDSVAEHTSMRALTRTHRNYHACDETWGRLILSRTKEKSARRIASDDAATARRSAAGSFPTATRSLHWTANFFGLNICMATYFFFTEIKYTAVGSNAGELQCRIAWWPPPRPCR